MKRMNVMLRKCKSLSLSRLSRSSSYSNLRSNSVRGDVVDDSGLWGDVVADDAVVVFVGNLRRRYTISEKHLSHPLVRALIERSTCDADQVSVKCEVVLFNHLLWMIDNGEPDAITNGSIDELAELYTTNQQTQHYNNY